MVVVERVAMVVLDELGAKLVLGLGLFEVLVVKRVVGLSVVFAVLGEKEAGG